MDPREGKVEVFIHIAEPKYATFKCNACDELLMLQPNLTYDEILGLQAEFSKLHRSCV